MGRKITTSLNQTNLLTPQGKLIKKKEAIKFLTEKEKDIKKLNWVIEFIKAKERKTIEDLKTDLTQKHLSSEPEYQNATDKILHLDLNTSSMMQNLGMRLLSSNKVRETYFPNKQTKLSTFPNLPTDERIIKLLDQTISDILKNQPSSEELKLSLFENDSYIELKNKIINNKHNLFTLSQLLPQIENVINTIQNLLIKNPHRKSYQQIGQTEENQIEKIITNLNKTVDGFLTKKTDCVSKAKAVQNAFSIQIQKLSYADKYKESVKKAYNELTTKEKISTLILNAKTNLLKSKKTEDTEEKNLVALHLMTDFQDSLSQEIDKLKTEFTRPTLNDSTSFSATDISTDGIYHGTETLFSYIRLIHCSAKRSLKNSKSDPNFDGTVIARGWQFDPNKTFSVVETQNVSTNGLNSMVEYAYNSNYSALASKLEALQKNYSYNNRKIIAEIKSILKTGHLLEGTNINEFFAKFLFTLTYHIFGTEVERHPASAIHNIMALDLFNNENINSSWLSTLPMSIDDAVQVARGLQTTLRETQDIAYYYDHNTNGGYSPEDNEAFQKFVHMEQNLAYEWLRRKDLSSDLGSAEALRALDDLCHEYYEISLLGESS